MTAAQDSRSQFEANFNHLDLSVRSDGWGGKEYKSCCTRTAWEAWQASRAALSAEPVAYLVERHAFRVSPDGQDADGSSWLEECLPTEPGAFPVYAAPQPRAFQTADGAQERKPLTDAQVEVLPVWRHFIGLFPDARLEITRAIERAHGITGEAV